MKLVFALIAATGIAIAVPSLAQDQKAPSQAPQADQGMGGMMMNRDMMTRMNKMMEQCEKMMSGGMHKGMGGKGGLSLTR